MIEFITVVDSNVIMPPTSSIAVFNLKNAERVFQLSNIECVWCINQESQPYTVALCHNIYDAQKFYNGPTEDLTPTGYMMPIPMDQQIPDGYEDTGMQSNGQRIIKFRQI